MHQNKLIITVFALAMLFTSSIAQARHFKVYGWGTPAENEFELVYWTDYVAKSGQDMNFFGDVVAREGLRGDTLEVEYGVTDRFTIAGYIDFEQPRGKNIEYIQSRVVALRYRFGERGAGLFDTAVYVEYYLPNQDYQSKKKEKIEARVILEKNFRDFNLRINPKFEKVVSGPDVEEGIEFEYGLSLYWRAAAPVQLGLEFYGGIGELTNIKPTEEQKHYIMPALKYDITNKLEWSVGTGFGISNAADDIVIKSILEWKV